MSNDWRDGFADFFGQGAADSVGSGRRFKPGSKGVVDTNVWDTIWGRSQTELNEAAATDKADKLQDRFKGQIESLGGTFDRGGTSGSYQAQVRSLTRKDENQAYEDSPAGKAQRHTQGLQNTNMTNQTQALMNQNSLGLATLKQTGDLAANQMEMARLDNKFDRETQAAQNNLTLQLGQMQSDLADKRLQYDRETRSMDKRDRAIAQLMSGLGSLGGAFSL